MTFEKDYVTSRMEIDHKTGCWNWTAFLDRDGYGRCFHVRSLAHRVSYEAFIGKIPKGLCVLHKCDNRTCINPEHLRLGTQADNMKDMYNKGRENLSGLLRGQTSDVLKEIAANIPRKNGRFAKKIDAAIGAKHD